MVEEVLKQFEQAKSSASLPPLAQSYYLITFDRSTTFDKDVDAVELKRLLARRWSCGVIDFDFLLPEWLSALHSQTDIKLDDRLAAIRDETKRLFTLQRRTRDICSSCILRGVALPAKVSAGPQSRREVSDFLLALGKTFPYRFQSDIPSTFRLVGQASCATELSWIQYPATLFPKFPETLESKGFGGETGIYWYSEWPRSSVHDPRTLCIFLTAQLGIQHLRNCINESFPGHMVLDLENNGAPYLVVVKEETKSSAAAAVDDKHNHSSHRCCYIQYPARLCPDLPNVLQENGYGDGGAHWAPSCSGELTLLMRLPTLDGVEGLRACIEKCFPGHTLLKGEQNQPDWIVVAKKVQNESALTMLF